jgi:hypothetical protein
MLRGNNLKKILVALALVALILVQITLMSAPHVKADASEAKILSYSWYLAPSNTVRAQFVGDLVVVGEVKNVGSNTLGYVVVQGIAYNSSGAPLATTDTQAFVPNLGPGQISPFYLDLTPENNVTEDQNWMPSATNVTLAVVYASDAAAQTQYSGLIIPAGGVSASLDSAGTYTVTGTVQNTGNQVTGHVWVLSTFYNASGTVVSLNYTNYISNSLSPGATANFVATPIDNTAQLSSSIANYSLLIQSDTVTTSATPTPTAPPTTTQPSSSPSSSTQPTQSPPTTISSSLMIDAVIVVVIIVLIVLATLLLLRRRQKNAQFELPPPPPPP